MCEFIVSRRLALTPVDLPKVRVHSSWIG